MHHLLHWLQSAVEARSTADPHPVSYVDFLSITLTALGVMLTALAIIIAVVAIWGYQGIKKSLTEAVRKNAHHALNEKLKEYPAAAEMVALRQRADSIEAIIAQIGAATTNPLASAPEPMQTGSEVTSPEFRAPDYPPQIGS